jgi:hypothetical protein
MGSGRRYELMLYALVALLSVLWVVGIIVASGGIPKDLDPDLEYYLSMLVPCGYVFGPWVVAIRLLCHAWSNRTGAGASPTDGAARLLAATAAMLPEERRDWGAAMIAELAQVRDRSARWWFATGCATVALFPPRARQGRVWRSAPWSWRLRRPRGRRSATPCPRCGSSR